MTRLMTMLALGALLSTPMLAETDSGDPGMAATTTTTTTTAATANDDALPCSWCCPPHICGINGPSFDGTTVPAECTAQ